MLYGGFELGSGRQRSSALNSLMNPVRGSNSAILDAGLFASGPAGPSGSFAYQRATYAERHPDWYRQLPPLPASHRRLQYSDRGPISVEPSRRAAIDNPYYDPRSEHVTRVIVPSRRGLPPAAGWNNQKEFAPNPEQLAKQRAHLEQLEKFKTSGLACNITRNSDLNQYERFAFGLEALNVDQLRLLKGLPVGTDLYRYKVEQSKEIGTMRGEVMKLVEENRLRAMKKSLDLQFNMEDRSLENKLWSDEQSKTIIQKRIREAMGKETNLEVGGHKLG